MIIAGTTVDSALQSAYWAAAGRCCSTGFLEATQAYRRWQDVQLRLAGRLLLQHMLKRYYGRELRPGDIGKGKYDKPYLLKGDAFFNISHSAEVVVCALTTSGEVGIDIERTNPIRVADFFPQMTGAERSIIVSARDPNHAFYDYWTSKESVLKVMGDGLNRSLRSFEVDEDRRRCLVDNRIFQLRPFAPAPDYLGYVAGTVLPDTVRMIDLPGRQLLALVR